MKNIYIHQTNEYYGINDKPNALNIKNKRNGVGALYYEGDMYIKTKYAHLIDDAPGVESLPCDKLSHGMHLGPEYSKGVKFANASAAQRFLTSKGIQMHEVAPVSL